jgi:hypothetical protein
MVVIAKTTRTERARPSRSTQEARTMMLTPRAARLLLESVTNQHLDLIHFQST